MIITVVGQHLVELPAELGTLHLDVVAADEHRATALERVQHGTTELLREVKRLKKLQPAPVERHVVNSPQVWSTEATDPNGNLISMQHRASVAVQVIFCDATALSEFTSTWGEKDEIQLGHVSWDLTEQTRSRHQDAVVAAAIADAQRRAAVMARAAGAGDPTMLELSDPGLLGGASTTAPDSGPMMFAQARAAKTEAIELAPEAISLSAVVHARFEA